MEESLSGFKRRGDWGDVVEHGERIARALRDINAHEQYPSEFEEWDKWRPKVHERLEEDVSEKTVEQIHVDEGIGERAGKTPNEDMLIAGEKLAESYDELNEDPEESVDKWTESIEFVARAADSAGRKALRKVEDTVYKRVMTQLAPYYFDNELISANIQQRVRQRDTFVFEINVNDDKLKEKVTGQLREYEELDRWHVTTEKDTEQVAAAEGVEPPETENAERLRSTRN